MVSHTCWDQLLQNDIAVFITFEQTNEENCVWQPMEQDLSCPLGGRDGILFLSCQSQVHQPIVGVCQLIQAEEGRQNFPPSVLRYPVTQHKHQFQVSQRKHVLAFSLHDWQRLYDMVWEKWLVGGNWQVTTSNHGESGELNVLNVLYTGT